MTSDDPTVDEVRRSLYGGPRATFIGRRKELAADARIAGDRDRAKLVESMRKPGPAAHLVNLLAHADDRSLHELIELGASIRHAMKEGDTDTMRSLLRDRPGVLATAVARAHEFARVDGQSVSGAVGDQIAQTLRAAMASDEAAAAVRSGALTDPLDEPGFGGVGIEPVAPSPRQTSSTRGDDRRRLDAAAERAAEQAADLAAQRVAAQARITSAAAALSRAEAALAAARKRRDELDQERDRLAVQLEQVDDDLAATRSVVDELDGERASAQAELEAAGQADRN